MSSKRNRSRSPVRSPANVTRSQAVAARSQATVNRDEEKLAEVEAEIAATPKLPEDIVGDLEPFEAPEADNGNAVRLRNAWTAVKKFEAGWKKALERADGEAQALKEERGALDTDRTALAERSGELEEREAQIARVELALEEQRSVAKAGFIPDLRAMTKEAAQRRDEMLAEATKLEDDARVRASAIVALAQQELDTERSRLAAERAELRSRELTLREKEVQVDADLAFAKVKESMLAERFEHRLENQVTDVREDLERAQALFELERRRAEARDRELRSLRDELARYDEDPESVKQRIDYLAQQLTALRDELSRRPLADEVAELRQRAKAAAEAQIEAAHWRQQYDQVERQLRYQLIGAGELEVLRDERDVLQAQRETLRQAIAQQRTDWEELQVKEGSKEPFPACSLYDRDEKLNRSVSTRGFDTLTRLVDEVRHRMATDSATAFYYSESDVRLFLAGLASSRLHLLQGISGTGKTSLPREFFNALGGGGAAQIIEVQAGWRDKDDLFGYYNAFEKRFAESEFTKALYRALMPANVDRPIVIVLDEMNLAHPEQYFGSMLSILENSATEAGYLDLLTSVLPGLPKRFEGSRLPLPRNVWFVGTANHDETTVAFADKTYDRAHVQELSSRHEPFSARQYGVSDPISFQELKTAFDKALREYRNEIDKAKNFLGKDLREEFERFEVGWGNRLERQMKSFVPVVLGSGGSLTEAVDHLVSTKLVRKLENRFGVRSEDLDVLADSIETRWNLDGEKPGKTTNRIRAEASRLRGGYES
jgi:hypothetical protein